MSVNEARFAIVAADFYEDLAARLISGAKAELSEAGAVTIDEFRVPGAFELPLAAQQAVKAGYHAVVCVGAVIRGETDHYDWVCAEAARGIMQLEEDVEDGIVSKLLLSPFVLCTFNFFRTLLVLNNNC